VYTLQRNLNFCIPGKEIARPRSQFPHSCVCERSIFPIFLQQKRQPDQRNIEIAHRIMNAGIWTVAAQFLSWEYLFRIFGNVSLQCPSNRKTCLVPLFDSFWCLHSRTPTPFHSIYPLQSTYITLSTPSPTRLARYSYLRPNL
jgi:hypothetical protein